VAIALFLQVFNR